MGCLACKKVSNAQKILLERISKGTVTAFDRWRDSMEAPDLKEEKKRGGGRLRDWKYN